MLNLIIAIFVLMVQAQGPQRVERLVALARLDAAVHYFHPQVALNSGRWDSLFCARATGIADAPTRNEYARRVRALVGMVLVDQPNTIAPQRALVYYGAPPSTTGGFGKRGLRWRSASDGETYRVDLGEGVLIDVPLTEASADTTGALELTPRPTFRDWTRSYPSTGCRLLTAARLWSTIRMFYPYRSLIDANWDDRLRVALPSFEGARDSLEYAKAIAAFMAIVPDAHVTVGSMALWPYFGAASIGAGARLIESRLVITRVFDSTATNAGLLVGDVVLSVDGETVERRIARLSPYIAAGTPQALRFRLQSTLLKGPVRPAARLVVERADGTTHRLTVPRAYKFNQGLSSYRTGEAIRVLDGNIGYVDLSRLSRDMVESAFRALAATKAIIFDGRGYPQQTWGDLAQRLTTHEGRTTGARMWGLVVPSPDTASTTVAHEEQPVPPRRDKPHYSGRTVLLIDERAISQAEHTGLILEAANGTIFVGSPTMGANGTMATMAVPGGINVTFTGRGVRHADGRELQGVGLQPQLLVSPTVAGIRAGRDEVLEAACALLSKP